MVYKGGVQLTERVRRQYTREFKKEAVELVIKQGYTVARAAKSLDINRSVLTRWRREYLEKEKGAFPGSGHQSGETEELSRLREENRQLRLEKEILKKAAAFFARESG
jgi:transposase